MADGHPPSLSN